MDKNAKKGASITRVFGLFEDETSVVRAVNELVKRGMSRERLAVMSSIPLPEGTFGTDTRPSRLPFIAAIGAIGGMFGGVLLAAGTALLYPLPTGGKPIVALPTVGVITYEVTMLGIILLTFIGVLYEMRLPRIKKPIYDPRISEGYVGLLVPCDTENQVAEVRQILQATGAVDIKRVDGE